MKNIFATIFYLTLCLLYMSQPGHQAGNSKVSEEVSRTALLQSNLMVQFAEVHKKIPRVTYFSCRDPAYNEVSDDVVRLKELRGAFAAKNSKLIKELYNSTRPMHKQQRQAFVRVVWLDLLSQLMSKQIRGSAGIKTFNGMAWLKEVLQVDDMRQIVVVDLACGVLSRRFLELASYKMLYNAKYHWLLIEDYELHLSVGVESVLPNHNENPAEDELLPIESFMERLNLYMDTELTLAKRQTHNISYKLYDAWSPGFNYGGHVNLTQIGSCNSTHNLQLQHWFRTTSTLLRRRNMQHARLRTTVVVTNKNITGDLLYYLTHPVTPHIDTMNRFNFNLLTAVRDMYNWSFVLTPTTSWGYLKNGRYDGMIGALIRNETDLGGSPIFYWLERHKWIDAAGQSWSSRPCFIFRHPHNAPKHRILFLQPFSNEVWIAIVVCGLLSVLILWLLTKLEWTLTPHSNDALIKPKGGILKLEPQTMPKGRATVDFLSVPKPLPLTGGFFRRCYRRTYNYINSFKTEQRTPRPTGLFLDAALFFVGILCQQGLGFSTSFISGRCIVITSLLFSFAIYQFYSASIVGTLLMERPKTIKTLKDLVESSLEVGLEDILYTRDYFLHTKDLVSLELYAKKISIVPLDQETQDHSGGSLSNDATKLYRDIMHDHVKGVHAKSGENSNWLDPDTGLMKVRNESFAFHVDVSAAYKIIADTFSERDICDLTEISMIPPQKTVTILQKNSPMRKVISYGLRRVTEAGIMSYHISIWHQRKPPCVKKIEASDLHVDMDTVKSALVILLISYGIALLILFMEIWYRKCQNLNAIITN